jgi:hypothetical protein
VGMSRYVNISVPATDLGTSRLTLQLTTRYQASATFQLKSSWCFSTCKPFSSIQEFLLDDSPIIVDVSPFFIKKRLRVIVMQRPTRDSLCFFLPDRDRRRDRKSDRSERGRHRDRIRGRSETCRGDASRRSLSPLLPGRDRRGDRKRNFSELDRRCCRACRACDRSRAFACALVPSYPLRSERAVCCSAKVYRTARSSTAGKRIHGNSRFPGFSGNQVMLFLSSTRKAKTATHRPHTIRGPSFRINFFVFSLEPSSRIVSKDELPLSSHDTA